MVKTRESSHARINKSALRDVLKIFGRVLTISQSLAVYDNFGQLSSAVDTSYTARGDLQFGLDINPKMIASGIVESGDGVLYLHPDDTQPNFETNDECFITIGDAKWNVEQKIESPTLDGTVCHYSYRCKRRINSNDFDD